MSKIYIKDISKRKAERLGLQKDKIGYYYIEPIEITTYEYSIFNEL